MTFVFGFRNDRNNIIINVVSCLDSPTAAVVPIPVVMGTKGDKVNLNCFLPNQKNGNREARFSWSRDDGWEVRGTDGSLQYTIDSYCHDKINCTPYNNAGDGTRGQISLRLTGEHPFLFLLCVYMI